MDDKTVVALYQAKSTGVAVVLSLLFGGFGLLYATISGGIIMSIVTLVTFIIALLTFGLGAVLFPLVNLICVAWAIVAVKNHNAKLFADYRTGS